MVSRLAQKECQPCTGDTPPLAAERVEALLDELDDWSIEQEYHLTKTYGFPDFAQAMAFADEIGALAEDEQHHPELHIGYGHVKVELWTHKIDGLTEADFVFAAKVDAIADQNA
jgi:4a-hydroxytetrahydrobiopterin dehydratase